MGLLDSLLGGISQFFGGSQAAVSSIAGQASEAGKTAPGMGGTAAVLVALVLFAPVFIGPLRLILASLTQSLALLFAHFIGFLTSLGVSILQFMTLLTRGVIPTSFTLRGWFGHSLLVLLGALIGILASQSYLSRQAAEAASPNSYSIRQTKQTAISVEDPKALAKAGYEIF